MLTPQTPDTTSIAIACLLVIPFVALVATMMLDEFGFHRERGLPRWERIGHPLDTLTMVICYAFLLATAPDQRALLVFVALALFSMLFAAKDEPIHARLCRFEEHLTHIALFVLHALVLSAAGLLWWLETSVGRVILQVQGGLITLFMVHQILYWNLLPVKAASHATPPAENQ